jgi:hypothetical protein
VSVLGWRTATRSFFSMCRSVVFPALSRPRKSSFACLLARPREARRSKTRWPYQRRVLCGDSVVLMDTWRLTTYTCLDISFEWFVDMYRTHQLTIHMLKCSRGVLCSRACAAAIYNVKLSEFWHGR